MGFLLVFLFPSGFLTCTIIVYTKLYLGVNECVSMGVHGDEMVSFVPFIQCSRFGSSSTLMLRKIKQLVKVWE